MNANRPHVWVALLCATLVACGGGGSGTDGDCDYGSADTDGDTITDCDEGRADDRNTDGDEWPDWRDLDSDGDFIPDADEAGDDDLSTEPVDLDGDGVAEYLDPDADDDGVLDGQVSGGDQDDDGTPDTVDDDIDGDTILNEDDGEADTDNDGFLNLRDIDSDDDGLLDSEEAGDDDPSTPPVDTDGDTIPDFLDSDSDDDGTPDIVERVAGSDPTDPDSNVPEGDFFFVLPYEGASQSGTFDFSTDLQQADVFFSVDTTGSFGEEIEQIQTTLQQGIIPGVTMAIDDVAYGVGRFEDFPLDPYGLAGDVPFELVQPVTEDVPTVQAGVDALAPAAGGLDTPEAGLEALYQWSTGIGTPAFGIAPFSQGGVGGVGFRQFSLPIFVQITDARSHQPADYEAFADEVHSRDEVVAALDGIGAKVIGIDSLENSGTADDPRAELEDLALATGTTIPPNADGECLTGVDDTPVAPVDDGAGPVCPLVFDVAPDGSGLGELIVDAITQLAARGSLDISTDPVGFDTEIDGTELPPQTDSSMFIKSITPVAPPPQGATIDGDEFRDVPTGSTVTFEVTAQNDFMPPVFHDRVMQIDINVLGDRVTLLDVRRVFVIVPRKVIQ